MIKCDKCFSNNTFLSYYYDKQKFIIKCNTCRRYSFITLDGVLIEFNHLVKLEKAANELHYTLSNHPTIQRLAANNDNRIDEKLCALESCLDLENLYQEINK